MRIFALLSVMVACSAGPAPADPVRSPAVPPNTRVPLPPSVQIRTLGAPAPRALPSLGRAVLSGSSWTLETLEDTRQLRFSADGATVSLAERDAAFTGDDAGGTSEIDGNTWTFAPLAPCAMAVYDPGREAWWAARRTEPVCTAAESVWDGLDLATWRLPGGDLYSILPGGKAWRRGPGRSFDRPVGDVVLPSGASPMGLVFGASRFDVVALDPCHQVFVLREPHRDHPAERTFPACAPGQGTHAGWAWTWWDVAGDTLSLLGDSSGRGQLPEGGFQLEGSGGTQRGRWERVHDEIVVDLEVGPSVLRLTDPCAGTLTRPDGQSFAARRTYPRCDPTE